MIRMNQMLSKYTSAFLLIGLSFSSAARSENTKALGNHSAPKTFTLRLPGEPETLDWNLAHTMVETYILMNLMEGLVTFDSSMKVIPSLASQWTVSPDGKTYTFNLKKGVKWSDGVPLRAQDFVFSWKRLLSPLTAASYAYFLFDIEGAEDFNKGSLKDFSKVGIKAIDDSTFQVKLTRPVAYWLDIPTFWVTFPLRQDIVEKHGSAWQKPGRMVTLGPFLLDSYEPDFRIVLTANPTYHGKKGNIERVVALVVKDAITAVNLYETGKIDFMTDFDTQDLKRLSGRPDLKIFPYHKVVYMGFTVSKVPVNNLRIRRAISMAIDKSKFDKILFGGQKSASTFIPPSLIGHSAQVGLSYDPVKARRELKLAEIPDSQALSMELLVPNWEKSKTIAEYVQAELKKNLKIDVIIQPFDHKTFRSQLDLNIYQTFITSWGADYPDPDNFASEFLANSGNNRTTWKNKEYDDLVLKARLTVDPKVRAELYQKSQKILVDTDAVVVPLFYEPNVALVKKRVSGLELNPLNYLLLWKVSVDL